jgi:CubicO group peptidase (beta-lactamase class C family)
MRHRAGLSQLNGVSKAELMDHMAMERGCAAASVNKVLYGKPAYHALTYGWLMSGLARAVTGKGMRDLIREELAEPLNTDGLHLAVRRSIRRRGPRRSWRRRARSAIRSSTSSRPGSRPAVLRRVRLDVLPGHEGRCAGRYPFLDSEIPRRTG